MFTVTLLVIGLLCFEHWIEGAIVAIMLDIIMFGATIGLHSLYIILIFCAVYYLSIHFKRMLRVV
jgi:hypothetical protein